jgi:hypothetical protein
MHGADQEPLRIVFLPQEQPVPVDQVRTEEQALQEVQDQEERAMLDIVMVELVEMAGQAGQEDQEVEDRTVQQV